jgi:hypothetical protein
LQNPQGEIDALNLRIWGVVLEAAPRADKPKLPPPGQSVCKRCGQVFRNIANAKYHFWCNAKDHVALKAYAAKFNAGDHSRLPRGVFN